MTEKKIYKAIFKCEALNERCVWYVGSRKEGRKHLRNHIGSNGKGTLSAYRQSDWTYELRPVFEDASDVRYDVLNSRDD
jgi:hypothetical protein